MSLGQEVCDGPGATTGSEGALLPLVVSCEVATLLAVTLPKLAVAEPVSAGELCQTGRYKNTCKLGETKKRVGLTSTCITSNDLDDILLAGSSGCGPESQSSSVSTSESPS